MSQNQLVKRSYKADSDMAYVGQSGFRVLKTSSLIVAALFVTASMAASLVEAESTQGDWCEQQWEIVSGDPGEGLQPL